jgi:hypothetical protein
LPRRIGESSDADTPLDFSRVSTCESGFQHLGQILAVCHSEAARSPDRFSHVRVSSGGDRMGGKGEGEDKDEEF